jgi:uncharacterized protein (TIGR02246 family)
MRRCLAVRISWFVVFTVTAAGAVDNGAQAIAETMVKRFVDSWNRADGAAYGENYWRDAELVDPTGGVVDRKAAIVREHIDPWNGIFKGSRATGKVRRIQMFGSDYMIVDFDVQISHVQELPPGAPAYPDRALRNHLKHTMEKRNGTWKVISAQNTFIAARP